MVNRLAAAINQNSFREARASIRQYDRYVQKNWM